MNASEVDDIVRSVASYPTPKCAYFMLFTALAMLSYVTLIETPVQTTAALVFFDDPLTVVRDNKVTRSFN
jgi:hypothetical protein